MAILILLGCPILAMTFYLIMLNPAEDPDPKPVKDPVLLEVGTNSE